MKTLSTTERRRKINARYRKISIRRQCKLLGLSRSSYYYRPRFMPRTLKNRLLPVLETKKNLRLMKRIDELYMAHPFYGSRNMTVVLKREGHRVNRKRIQRLMRLMGIQAIYPKPRLSIGGKDHKIYPYLLKNLTIDRVDQVWCADITYIRLAHGFVYLVAIMDWYSRRVLSWRLSNTLDTEFCLEALEEALEHGKPEIFNTDQGCQFTSESFTGRLKKAGIQISMDGRGRVFDNILIERLWRTLKYQDIYIKDYKTVMELSVGLDAYFQFYNNEKPHQSLENRTPSMVYYSYEYQRTA
jgi:putative transposase